MIFFTEGKPVSKTPSPKYPHNLKTSSNVESVSESDEDDEREEVISYCYEGSIVLHWVLRHFDMWYFFPRHLISTWPKWTVTPSEAIKRTLFLRKASLWRSSIPCTLWSGLSVLSQAKPLRPDRDGCLQHTLRKRQRLALLWRQQIIWMRLHEQGWKMYREIVLE